MYADAIVAIDNCWSNEKLECVRMEKEKKTVDLIMISKYNLIKLKWRSVLGF